MINELKLAQPWKNYKQLKIIKFQNDLIKNVSYCNLNVKIGQISKFIVKIDFIFEAISKINQVFVKCNIRECWLLIINSLDFLTIFLYHELKIIQF